MKKKILVALTALFTLSASLTMAQPPQGGQGGPERISPEEQVETLKSELKLDKKQCEEALKVFTDISKEQEKLMSGGGRPDREAMDALMEKQQKAMKEILTKEQYAAWEKAQEARRPQGQGGRR